MTDPAMLPAIRAAIKANEIGTGDPYALSFAKKGDSGASFGIFQNDTAANSQALDALNSILQTAGLPAEQVQRIIGLVNKPCPTDPLTSDDEAAADAALSSYAGKQAVDALDDRRLTVVCGYLDQSVQSSVYPIEGEAQLGICMWCNMTGAPTTLLTWLGGSSVDEAGGTVDPPGNPVSFDDLTRLLKNATFFVNNPDNWQHFADSADEGAKLLPPAPSPAIVAFQPAATMVNVGGANQSVGLTGTEGEFVKALLAIAQKLTDAQRTGVPAPFPHGIGTVEIAATVEPLRISFSLKITDADGRPASAPAARPLDAASSSIAATILTYCVALDTNDDPVMKDCNAFVKNVAGNFGVTIDATLDADGIVDSFTNAPFTKTTMDPSAAISWANEGLVVAGMKRAELDGAYGSYSHGHVAIVHDIADPNHPGFPMASWGTLGGRGKSDTSIRQSFPAAACDDDAVHFAFAPTSSGPVAAAAKRRRGRETASRLQRGRDRGVA
jgi:hypothetical protein